VNRIDKLFKESPENILSIYFTAGYPKITDTPKIIRLLEKSGADMIEIGIPFSDPVADGPTIQDSNKVALENGMTLEKLFEQINDLRQDVSIPVVLMGYINPVLQYGFEKFCKKAKEVGVDGLILPDLPIEVFIEEYKTICDKYGLKNTFLITPQTTEERIRLIDEKSDGFIYMVSSASTTGAKNSFGSEVSDYFNRVNAMNLRSPKLVGFGISNKETFDSAAQHSNGAIIGSAFIKLLAQSTNMEKDIKDFIKNIKE